MRGLAAVVGGAVAAVTVWHANGLYESRFSQNRTSLPKSIFLSAGFDEPAEMKEYFQPFVDGLRSRGYSGLQFHAAVLAGETHLTAFSAGPPRGLRAVF